MSVIKSVQAVISVVVLFAVVGNASAAILRVQQIVNKDSDGVIDIDFSVSKGASLRATLDAAFDSIQFKVLSTDAGVVPDSLIRGPGMSTFFTPAGTHIARVTFKGVGAFEVQLDEAKNVVAAVPVPVSAVLMISALVALVAIARRGGG